MKRNAFMLVALIVSATSAVAQEPLRADDMPWVTVSKDKKGFALEPSNRPFIPWGFNYDHDTDGRLIEDYWIANSRCRKCTFANPRSHVRRGDLELYFQDSKRKGWQCRLPRKSSVANSREDIQFRLLLE